MVTNFATAFEDAGGYDIYGKFLPKTLDGSYDINNYASDGMNMRNILGRDCVNSIFE